MRSVERTGWAAVSDPGGERGTVMVAFIIALPVFLVAASLVTDARLRIWAKTVAQASADLAALAAVQELDLDRLSRGQRWIVEGAAVASARDVALDNVDRNVRTLLPGTTTGVLVTVLNPDAGGTVVHPRDGRRLRDPTVFVMVAIESTALMLGPVGGRISVTAHADASVVEKRQRICPTNGRRSNGSTRHPHRSGDRNTHAKTTTAECRNSHDQGIHARRPQPSPTRVARTPFQSGTRPSHPRHTGRECLGHQL